MGDMVTTNCDSMPLVYALSAGLIGVLLVANVPMNILASPRTLANVLNPHVAGISDQP